MMDKMMEMMPKAMKDCQRKSMMNGGKSVQDKKMPKKQKSYTQTHMMK